jgi:hypothetical protein
MLERKFMASGTSLGRGIEESKVPEKGGEEQE